MTKSDKEKKQPRRRSSGGTAGADQTEAKAIAPAQEGSAAIWLFGDPGPRKALPALALLTVLLLVPFADKAFHIDDPMYLKAAHQITSHPLDPYGFSVNWFRGETMMADAMKNPPLSCYYIAAMAALF